MLKINWTLTTTFRLVVAVAVVAMLGYVMMK